MKITSALPYIHRNQIAEPGTWSLPLLYALIAASAFYLP